MTTTLTGQPGEHWKPVPGGEGKYWVSNLGRIYSVPRPKSKGGLLSQRVGNKGYYVVNLYIGNCQKTILIHQLVMAAFVGPRPNGLETRHLDGNYLNNALKNLAYGTRSQNALDRITHGTDCETSRTHCPHGHEYNEENTYVYRGGRHCRQCNNKKTQEYKQKKKARSQS